MAILTVNLAVCTVFPVITIWPVTELLRPTAVWAWPTRTSWTRYPTCEPEPAFHEPATESESSCAEPEPEPEPEPELALWLAPALRLSGAGVLPSTKWK